jgi:hypothetical protein
VRAAGQHLRPWLPNTRAETARAASAGDGPAAAASTSAPHQNTRAETQLKAPTQPLDVAFAAQEERDGGGADEADGGSDHDADGGDSRNSGEGDGESTGNDVDGEGSSGDCDGEIADDAEGDVGDEVLSIFSASDNDPDGDNLDDDGGRHIHITKDGDDYIDENGHGGYDRRLVAWRPRRHRVNRAKKEAAAAAKREEEEAAREGECAY